MLQRFMAAWESADLEALAALLADDARLVMPPYPTWFSGRADVIAFLGGRIDWFDRAHVGRDWRLVPTGANGQPAFGLYTREEGDRFVPFATGVLRVGPEGIEEVTLFIGNLACFDRFALPASA